MHIQQTDKALGENEESSLEGRKYLLRKKILLG